MFYLIVLCLAEPLDVFNREETNERKRTSGNEPIEHTRRCIERAVRSPVVSLDSCLADLMRKHAFSIQARATSAKIIYPGPHCICRSVKPSAFIIFSLKMSSNISRASSSCQEMAESSASPTSTVLEHQLLVRHYAWTIFGISLFGQIHCETGFDVCKNTT